MQVPVEMSPLCTFVNIIFFFSIIHRLCTDLQTLIQERAEIEKGYAKNLRAWSKKWGELIEKGKRQVVVSTDPF